MNIRDLLQDAYKEGMTIEEINEALESIEMPTDGSAEIERLRKALSKSNSESAEYKRQLREKMTEDEQKANEDAERFEKLQKDYDELVRKVTLSENKAKLLSLGYEDALATETAEAMVNGEIDKVFANQKKHIESVEKKVRSELTKDTPKPDGGNSGVGITKEALLKMSSGERLRFSQEHPEEYRELYGGN